MILLRIQDIETINKYKHNEKEEQIKKLEESVAFLASQPGNKILYEDNENNKAGPGIVKGIELKLEINNKVVGKIIPSSNSSTFTSAYSNNKKK